MNLNITNGLPPKHTLNQKGDIVDEASELAESMVHEVVVDEGRTSNSSLKTMPNLPPLKTIIEYQKVDNIGSPFR